MKTEIDKAKYEQEQKRKLWHEQQKARLGENLPEKMGAGNFQTKKEEQEKELPQGRSPGAIAARLRAAQARESAAKQKIAKSSKNQASAKAEEFKKTAQRLKNLYRIINGAAGVTVVGLIWVFLVMNAQLFFGNLLKIKLLPPLSFIEIIIICVFNLVFFAILLILTVLIVIMVTAVTDPLEIIKLLPGISWDVFKGLFK